VSDPAGARADGSRPEPPGNAFHHHAAAAARPRPKFRSFAWRAGNTFVGALARAGIGPMHLLITHGRKTGRPHTVPVVPVELDGKRWLVAPYGTVSWVRNARVAGRVSLRYGRAVHEYGIREAAAEAAGPVLKRYVAVATKTRAQFDANPHSPAADFVLEAGRHPVFELIPISNEATPSE
jgi:deazaflavin-dependent oxidoreductase (nitroreductase family)